MGMRTNRTCVLLAAAPAWVLAVSTPVHAEMRPDNGPPYIQLQGQAVLHDERIPKKESSAGVRLGLGLPCCRTDQARMGWELNLFSNPVKSTGSDGDRQTGLMLDVMHVFADEPLETFIYAGLGLVHEAIGSQSRLNPALEAGMGIMAGLGYMDWKLRLEISGNNVFNSKVRADKDSYLDGRIGLGLMAPFGMRSRLWDHDDDGVIDRYDHCPGTAAGSAVNTSGCALRFTAASGNDSDADGVLDSNDACPGTLRGLLVDAGGCVSDSTPQTVVLKGVTFPPKSAALSAEAQTVLDQARTALVGQPNLKVEIGGHTDSGGKDDFNLALSQERARAVRRYLVDGGIDPSRLIAKGYGETQPVADNRTAAGRGSNRRVELKILN